MKPQFKTILTLVLLISSAANGQPEEKEKPPEIKGYGFEIEKSIESTPVKSQDRTGTCWCFAGASFLESELIRNGKGTHNISEMFIVKNVYKDKAMNYVLRSGKANFGQGALAHDFINAVDRHGFVPEAVFMGRESEKAKHDHTEMESLLKGMLDALIKQKSLSKKWRLAYDRVLDVYIGENPQKFEYLNTQHTPGSLAKAVDFVGQDYISLTSYTHHPFHSKFVLEIPDNNSNGSFYNLPISDLVDVIDHAIENGYSVAWDGDVSEAGFSSAKGIAVLPADPKRKDALTEPGPEKAVSQEMRQETFYSYATTDDHLMHLTGISRDKNGNKYYVIKNSWGTIGPYKGFIHMSEAYVRLKTVAILIHKDGIPKDLIRQ